MRPVTMRLKFLPPFLLAAGFAFVAGCDRTPSDVAFQGTWTHVQHVADEAARRETIVRVVTDGRRFRIESFPVSAKNDADADRWIYDGTTLHVSSVETTSGDQRNRVAEKTESPAAGRLKALRFWRTDVGRADRIGPTDAVAGRPGIQYVYVEPRPDAVLRIDTVLDAETGVALKRETLVLNPADNKVLTRGLYTAERITYQAPPADAFLIPAATPTVERPPEGL